MATKTNQQLITWAESVFKQYSARISAILGIPVQNVTFTTGNIPYAGQTSGTTITLGRQWFKAHPDDVGGVVHEIVHAFMQDQTYGKKDESIADAVRYQMGLTYAGWSPSDAVLKLAAKTPDEFRAVVQNQASSSVYTAAASDTSQNQNLGSVTLTGHGGKTGEGALTLQQVMNYWDKYGQQLQAQGMTLDDYLNQFGFTQQDLKGSNVDTTGLPPPVPVAGTAPERADYIAQAIALGLKPGEVMSTIEAALAGEWSMSKFTNALRKDPDFQARFQLGYEATLFNMGIDITPGIQSLLNDAVAHSYNDAEFLYKLEQTPEFRDRFPGIFLPNGQLSMSPAEYLATEQQYRTLAKKYGEPFNSHIEGSLFRKGITPDLYNERLQAVQRVEEYRPALAQFEKVLQEKGLLPNGFGKEDVYKLVMGQANPLWYKIWEEASARTAAVTADLTIGSGPNADVTGQFIRQLIRRLPGQQTEASLTPGFSQVAEGIRTVIPLSEARKYGVTKEDILRAAFGGKGSSLSKDQIERALATAQAFGQERAAPAEVGTDVLQQQSRGGTAQ